MQENIHFPSYPSSSHNFLKKLAKQTNGCQLENGAIHQDLDIAVVGAGVGGLSAAIALKKAGFDVTVYEAASALGEYRKIGAGIQVPPNSSRILHSWGLEETLNKKAVKPEGVYWRRWQNGKVIGNSRFNPEFSKWFGAPYYVIHRAHLHEVLHDRAVELGVPIELNWRVVKYDLDAGSLTRGDGATIHADLIVAADGKDAADKSRRGANIIGLRYTVTSQAHTSRRVVQQTCQLWPSSLQSSYTDQSYISRSRNFVGR
ncbi:hypothetical protein LTR96_011076 [Exophiala xenobiotica]|nr:hypothetical protein LTR96_011076 [Exophiala xenobiotica]KAK5285284.1 hypothetical protein LTR14_011096 [Exophiala xenobiotica]KAK5345174.1 hypothetical protein LTR61_011080 [Exophiala xenobiotica]KAK5470237.1 hypothetical protein LTR55_011099 [Exophiala xenobiotica]KAK5550910.1 hypothetical protein LTR46_011103 [Exophiala xenobiotica]